jgi:hypothetical protein
MHDVSVWKRRIGGKLVFKFQKPSGVSGASYIPKISVSILGVATGYLTDEILVGFISSSRRIVV